MTYLCWDLLIAEFLRNSLMLGSAWITLPRWVKSPSTVWSAWFLDAAVNNEPAYLPAGVSAIDGGLWPLINGGCTFNRLSSLCLSSEVEFCEQASSSQKHHFVVFIYLIIKYIQFHIQCFPIILNRNSKTYKLSIKAI